MSHITVGELREILGDERIRDSDKLVGNNLGNLNVLRDTPKIGEDVYVGYIDLRWPVPIDGERIQLIEEGL